MGVVHKYEYEELAYANLFIHNDYNEFNNTRVCIDVYVDRGT